MEPELAARPGFNVIGYLTGNFGAPSLGNEGWLCSRTQNERPTPKNEQVTRLIMANPDVSAGDSQAV